MGQWALRRCVECQSIDPYECPPPTRSMRNRHTGCDARGIRWAMHGVRRIHSPERVCCSESQKPGWISAPNNYRAAQPTRWLVGITWCTRISTASARIHHLKNVHWKIPVEARSPQRWERLLHARLEGCGRCPTQMPLETAPTDLAMVGTGRHGWVRCSRARIRSHAPE